MVVLSDDDLNLLRRSCLCLQILQLWFCVYQASLFSFGHDDVPGRFTYFLPASAMPSGWWELILLKAAYLSIFGSNIILRDGQETTLDISNVKTCCSSQMVAGLTTELVMLILTSYWWASDFLIHLAHSGLLSKSPSAKINEAQNNDSLWDHTDVRHPKFTQT